MSNSAPPRDAASVIAQEFLVDEPCTVAVDVPGAHTRLRPGQQTDRVEVNVSVTGCPPDDAEDILDRMGVGTHQMKDAVRVYSDGDRSDAVWWRWIRTLDVTIHVDLKLPASVEADLRAPGGEVDVADLEGRVDIEAMGARCRVENLNGVLNIRGDSSEVMVTHFAGEKLDLQVAAGSLDLEDVEADTINIHSVCAPVQAVGLTGDTSIIANAASVTIEDTPGPLSARCQGSDLQFEGAFADEVELTTVGASLTVRIPDDQTGDLAMHGETLDLDAALDFSGERTEHEIAGSLSGGGPALSLRAIRGNISLSAR